MVEREATQGSLPGWVQTRRQYAHSPTRYDNRVLSTANRTIHWHMQQADAT
jgi:hypothetical protein